jgi:hypothetical protein
MEYPENIKLFQFENFTIAYYDGEIDIEFFNHEIKLYENTKHEMFTISHSENYIFGKTSLIKLYFSKNTNINFYKCLEMVDEVQVCPYMIKD